MCDGLLALAGRHSREGALTRLYLVQHGDALAKGPTDPTEPVAEEAAPGELLRGGSGHQGLAVRPFRSALLALLLALLALAGSSRAGAEGEIHPDVPQAVDPASSHLFYLHGAWIEQGGLERPHPVHGRYEYQAIVRALADRGFVVISEARQGETDAEGYARKVASQVRRLLEAGVPPSRVAVIGHSKGGMIALLAASELQEEKLGFAILAGCGKPGSGFRQSFERFLEGRAARLRGRFLSIYDASDEVAGSCREAFERGSAWESAEVVLQTGLGHALFWAPRPAWIDAVVEWAEPKP